MDKKSDSLDQYIVGNINLYNFIFTKRGKNYTILLRNGKDYGNYRKFAFCSPRLKIPFGIENYNYKKIINLQFIDYKKDNKLYNFYSCLKQLDNFFYRLSYDTSVNKHFSNNLIEQLKDKKYIPTIKKSYTPLLRTHLKETKKEIQTNIIHDGVDMSLDELKGTFCTVKIELGSNSN
jgi:hypothetical protein